MRWVLVTGATSGIGRACARVLAKAGYGVVACGRNRQALESLASEASREALRLVPHSLDVTDAEQIHEVVRATNAITEGSGIDALVNNAGYGQTGFLVELSRDQIRRQFEVNLFSVLELTRELLPQLERNRGTVINMGSIISRLAVPWAGLYGTVKSALRVLTDVMRVELHAAGIHVVLVEPGAIRTPFFDTAIASQATGEAREAARTAEAAPGTPLSPLSTLAALYGKAREHLAESRYRPFLLFPAISPERVAMTVLKIVRNRPMRHRYVVPPGSGALLQLLRLVPQAMLDHFKRRAFYLA